MEPYERETILDCYTFTYAVEDDTVKTKWESGDKICLPHIVSRDLLNNVDGPWQFKLTNPVTGLYTHVGALGRTAQPSQTSVNVPQWILSKLQLEIGSKVRIEQVALPKAVKVVFKPDSETFFEDVTNQKTALEQGLQTFACLTKGDTIRVICDGCPYDLHVEKLCPENACSIIDTDLTTDFVESDEGKQKREAREAREAKAAERVRAREAPKTSTAFTVSVSRKKAEKGPTD